MSSTKKPIKLIYFYHFMSSEEKESQLQFGESGCETHFGIFHEKKMN